jgi:hypothetical protein
MSNDNYDKNQDSEFTNDKSLQCIRIELNSHVTVFLYYKIYPKTDSKRFPQDRSAILFYFDNENINHNFLKTYLSLVGSVDEIEIGSYINRKGSKKKRRIVNFAIVKFMDPEHLNSLMNRYETQMKINNFLENKKNRKINLSYDPLNYEDDEENVEAEVDEDGFVEVKYDNVSKRFSKNGLSFKVAKGEQENENKKENKNDFYWNHQILAKKRQSKYKNLI